MAMRQPLSWETEGQHIGKRKQSFYGHHSVSENIVHLYGCNMIGLSTLRGSVSVVGKIKIHALVSLTSQTRTLLESLYDSVAFSSATCAK